MEIGASLLVAGRILLGGLFLFSGVRHFFIAGALAPVVQARGVPAPRLVLYVGSAFEAALGALLMLGLFVAPAALGLVVFTIIATIMLVNFWDKTGPERDALMNVALSNMAIIGGLLIAASSAS